MLSALAVSRKGKCYNSNVGTCLLYGAYICLHRSEALATTLSALYGKLLVVMGVAFPMAEVISTYIPPSFYERYSGEPIRLLRNSLQGVSQHSVCSQGFYLYLYIGSMAFLLYMYAALVRDRSRNAADTDIVASELHAGSNNVSKPAPFHAAPELATFYSTRPPPSTISIMNAALTCGIESTADPPMCSSTTNSYPLN
ncbi:Proton channel OtopLc [Eumeta japonica]|uniref:Proton channel OtopLc n=1 Tax=Eumeta variegata TaxID=151549 RepID=A0A4C1YSU0_EUMVA|nr:Proton channel OtopLc [Eumeta japonica]